MLRRGDENRAVTPGKAMRAVRPLQRLMFDVFVVNACTLNTYHHSVGTSGCRTYPHMTYPVNVIDGKSHD